MSGGRKTKPRAATNPDRKQVFRDAREGPGRPRALRGRVPAAIPRQAQVERDLQRLYAHLVQMEAVMVLPLDVQVGALTRHQRQTGSTAKQSAATPAAPDVTFRWWVVVRCGPASQ